MSIMDKYINGGLPVKNPLEPANSNPETFSVIIRNNINRLSGSSTDGTFMIDWRSFLPQKYDKFLISAFFRSDPNTFLTVTEDTVYIYIEGLNLGNVFDVYRQGKSQVVSLASIELWGVVGASTYYINQTNFPFTQSMNYPTQSVHRIYMTDHTGTVISSTKITDWSLILQITPVL